MRFALFNYINLGEHAKLFLRACIERNLHCFPTEEHSIEILTNPAFVSSKLTFAWGLEAIRELEKLQLIEVKEDPTWIVLKYTNVCKYIKTCMEDMAVNHFALVPVVDYKEICSLVEQKELVAP